MPADQYRVREAGLKVEMLFPVGMPRIPQPGSRMYKHLTRVLLGYWIDPDQVLYHPPRPRLSDGHLGLMLPEEGALIQFGYDKLSVTVNDAIRADPKVIGTILDSLCDVASRELPDRDLWGPVFVRYWAHASLLTGQASDLLGKPGSTVWAPGLQVHNVTLRLQVNEAASPDVSIEVGTSETIPNGLFLDYNAVIDKEGASSLLSVVSEAFRARADLLEKLNLHSDGNEEFASCFTTEPMRDGQTL